MKHPRTAPRTRAARACPRDATGGPLVLHAGNRHGELWFRLQPHLGGLYVEREELGHQGRRCLQSVHFSGPEAFERWCGDDPVRFDHPILYAELRRHAAGAWHREGETGP